MIFINSLARSVFFSFSSNIYKNNELFIFLLYFTQVTELELETFFCDYGLVKDVRIVTDRITGESKG